MNNNQILALQILLDFDNWYENRIKSDKNIFDKEE